MATTSRGCPTCGTKIPSGFPAGLCPACMLTGFSGAEDSNLSPERRETSPTSASHQAPSPETGDLPDSSFVAPNVESVRSALIQVDHVELLEESRSRAVYRARLRFDARNTLLQLIRIPEKFEEKDSERVLGEMAESGFPGWPEWIETGRCEIDSRPFFFLQSLEEDEMKLRDLFFLNRSSPERVLSIFRSLCELLVSLHRAGLAHHALAPETIILSGEDQVRFSPLGIGQRWSRILSDEREAADETDVASPYLAPECWEDRSGGDPRSDVFSLGVMLYEAISGEVPGLGGDLRPLSDFLSDSQFDLDALVFRAMERDPNRRPEVVDLLERLTPPIPAPVPIPLSQARSSRPVLLWVVGGILIIALVIWALR